MRPTPRRRSRPWLRWLLLAALLVLIVVGIYGGVLASQAGLLPWQEEPTRISDEIAPFSGLDVPGAPTPNTETPAGG